MMFSCGFTTGVYGSWWIPSSADANGINPRLKEHFWEDKMVNNGEYHD
jgi:hypothetical protein